MASLRPSTLAALLVASILLAGCQPETEAAAPDRPAPVVEVMTVREVSLVESHRYTGTVQPRRTVLGSFRVGGKVVERTVDPGDRVRAGTILARLDATDLELAVAKAEASLAAARSNRERAVAEERRGADLLARGHASQADYDGRALALAEAEARSTAAGRELDLARNQLGYAVLLASVDGVVSETPVEPGQVVAAGAPVIAIAEGDSPEVLAAIPESRIGDLAGARAEVSLWAGGHEYPAVLRELSPTADPATRTYAARFRIEKADDAIRFGMTATVTLSRGSPDPVIRIPATALHDEGLGTVVFAVSDGSVASTPVEVLRYESDGVLVSSGLASGSQIVTAGVNRLQDGQAVRPTAAPAAVALR